MGKNQRNSKLEELLIDILQEYMKTYVGNKTSQEIADDLRDTIDIAPMQVTILLYEWGYCIRSCNGRMVWDPKI